MSDRRGPLGCAIPFFLSFLLGFCCGATTIKVIQLVTPMGREVPWPPWFLYLSENKIGVAFVLSMVVLGCLLINLLIAEYKTGRRSRNRYRAP